MYLTDPLQDETAWASQWKRIPRLAKARNKLPFEAHVFTIAFVRDVDLRMFDPG